MSKTILEQFDLHLDEAKIDPKTGRVPIQIITPGWGSSGHYSASVLEAAAPLFKSGLPMYLDHATEAERLERPIRSVKDIAATFTKDAKWDGKRLVTEAQLVGPYKDALIALGKAKAIGVSINGSATDITIGEAEGRTGPIIEGLAKIDSVDFVTRAGRGGEILVEAAIREHELLESAAADLELDEATASDRMGHLRSAVKDTHSGDGKTAWVRDQDAEKSTVWFDVYNGGQSKTFEQTYKVGANDVDVALTGTPTEVRPVTDYVPVTRPDSSNPTTEDDQEVTMGNIQIEESEHKALTEKAGRVDTLESERDTAVKERDELREEKADRGRRDAAAAIVEKRATEAEVSFSSLERAGLLAALPLKENDLDTEAFTKTVDEAAAEKKTAGGAGSITGFGGAAAPQGSEVSESDIDKAVAGAFGRPVKEA